MHRIIERLERSLSWNLFAPDPRRLPAAMRASVLEDYGQRLKDIQAARIAVFGVDDGRHDEGPRSTDSAAWHFVATERSGEPAGALRLFIVDRRREALQPSDVLDFGHVDFPCPATRAAHLMALERLFEQMAGEPIYIYAGGFFTTEKWRGSGLAAVLGMAAMAMGRLHDCQFSASFVSARDRAPALFALLGAQPLRQHDEGPLGPFFCPRHGFPLQLMAFDSRRPDPKVERGLDEMVCRLQQAVVITPA